MLIVSVIFANGAYHTSYVGLKTQDNVEVVFNTEQACLDQVDGVGHRARANEWVPGRKTQAMPVGGVCVPASLADFVRQSASPRVTPDKVKTFTLPAGVLSDYTPPPPPPTAPPPGAAPAPGAPGQVAPGQPKGR